MATQQVVVNNHVYALNGVENTVNCDYTVTVAQLLTSTNTTEVFNKHGGQPVQTTSVTSGFAAAVPAGALLHVKVMLQAPATVTSFTDTKGNVYQQVASVTTGGGLVSAFIFICNGVANALTTSDTVSAAFSQASTSLVTAMTMATPVEYFTVFKASGLGGAVPSLNFYGLQQPYSFIGALIGETDVAAMPAGWGVIHNDSSNGYFSRDIGLFTQTLTAGTVACTSAPVSPWALVAIATGIPPVTPAYANMEVAFLTWQGNGITTFDYMVTVLPNGESLGVYPNLLSAVAAIDAAMF